MAATVHVAGHDRRAFFVSEACEGRALLLAPKRRASRIEDATSALLSVTPTSGIAPIETQLSFACGVSLLVADAPIESRTFSLGGAVSTVTKEIAVSRVDYAGVPLLTLHDAVYGDPRSPATLGLSREDHERLQREAARLLGLRFQSV